MTQSGEASVEYKGLPALQDGAFAGAMRVAAGTDLSRCYQCQTCTLGCPVAHHMDVPPHMLVRMVQLGLRDQVLSCATLQICVSCETCSTRCPNDIHVDKMIDALRVEALRTRVPPAVREVRAFHRAFLAGIRSRGRVWEVGMIVRLKLATLNLFEDVFSGMKMFLKGKLGLIPHGIRGKREVRRIFEETVDK